MMPMLPICDPRAMRMPASSGMMAVQPPMVPMMPVSGVPILCPPNNFNMCSTTTTMTNEYDSHMYGRFRHVERQHPLYRHAPFDWYRPPKQRCNIVHEDAAVVTLDGPVPIGDFYRYYIYGDGIEDYDDYDDYDDDDDSSSFESEEYDDVAEPSYEPRSVGYRRYARAGSNFDDEDVPANLPPNRSSGGRSGNYSSLYPNRRTAIPAATGIRGNRSLAGDDDFNDAASVNSTYAN